MTDSLRGIGAAMVHPYLRVHKHQGGRRTGRKQAAGRRTLLIVPPGLLAPGDGQRTTACWQRGSRGSRSEGLAVSTPEDLHEATTAENYHLFLTSLGRETRFLLVPVLR